ncbi:MAG: hypothetical protein J0H79_11445 [Alphaproteobacteria bacterium]|nr:hypothetical protein [Alphaproteobacteria bacterium]
MSVPLPSGAKKERKSHLWARDPDDWYVEPRWCNDALFAAVQFEGVIVDPCCGVGRVLDAAKDAGYDTIGMDLRDRGARDRHPFEPRDFFTVEDFAPNIVCNPPYKYAERFVAHCIAHVMRKTAVLLRAQWANGRARSRWLESLPLRHVLALSPRPSMLPGAAVVAGERAGSGTTDYSWFIFERDYAGRPEFGWARQPGRGARK